MPTTFARAAGSDSRQHLKFHETFLIGKAYTLASVTSWSIHLAPMPDAENQYGYLFIFNSADYSPVTYTIFPELSESRALQRLTDAAWIVELSNSVM